MKVTIVDSDVSYPMTSGKRLRTLNLLLPLAGRHELTYIGRSEGPEHSRIAAEFLADHGIKPIMVEAPLRQKSGATLLFRAGAQSLLAAALLRHQPHQACDARGRPETCCRFRRRSLASRMVGLSLLRGGRAGPVVLQAHNVDALIWKRYYESERNPARRFYIRNQWRKTSSVSKAKLFAASTASSQSATRMPASQKIAMATCRSMSWKRRRRRGISPDLEPSVGTNSILFLGALDWRPNIDAVELLLGDDFPAVRALRPDARLDIVGRHPADALRRRIAATPNATLHADVPDVKPFLTSNAVMAVPLRVGGGSRLKILEALAAGLPVVSTAVGAEGLEIRQRPALRARGHRRRDGTGARRDALRRVASRRMAEAGRSTVAQRYDWTMLAARLEQIWERTVATSGSCLSLGYCPVHLATIRNVLAMISRSVASQPRQLEIRSA